MGISSESKTLRPQPKKVSHSLGTTALFVYMAAHFIGYKSQLFVKLDKSILQADLLTLHIITRHITFLATRGNTVPTRDLEGY